jgi:hypothetical protein
LSGPRPWFRHPGRLAGVTIGIYFAAKLLILGHLGVVGRIVPAYSGRLNQGQAAEAGAPVIYFYQVGDASYHGWRRGIEYGAQELSVSASPLWPRWHLISTRPGLLSARAFWAEPDYWLRLLLALGGIAVGCGIERAWLRFERRGGTFLAGLDPDERRCGNEEQT